MRPVVVPAVLVLVGLMSVSEATVYIQQMCHTTYPPVACPLKGKEDWFQMGQNRCVKAVYCAPFLNFTDAEKACVGHGGHLVSIHNQQELDQVVCNMYRLTPGTLPYWIGLKLSFYYENDLIYDWTDGTDYDFEMFARGQPNFYNEQQECVEINYKFWGLWNDLECSFRRGYVCAVNITEAS